MKPFFWSLIAVTTGLTPLAFAFPGVQSGDTVEFVGYVGDDPSQLSLREITSIHFEEGASTGDFHSIIYRDGKVVSDSSKPIELKFITTQEKGAEFVKNCETQQGVRQANVITPAGTFETCRLTTSSLDGGTSLFDVAAVPFGTVKYVTETKEGKQTMILLKFSRGEQK